MIFPEHMEFRYYITPERKEEGATAKDRNAQIGGHKA